MFDRLNDESRLFLSRGYLSEGQTTEERIRYIADNAEKILGIKGFSDKFYDYMSKGYYSLATPIWCNFGLERGMPISCFSLEIPDSISGIMRSAGELGVMSKLGGGVGTYFGNIRPRGSEINGHGESSGSIHFMELIDKVADTISQGASRRGFTTPYLPIDHGDIEEFLEIGSEGSKIQRCTTAVVIPEGRMDSMLEGEKDKRKIWAKVMQSRGERGYPYIMYKDNCNNQAPQVYKDKGLSINTQNICMIGTDRVITSRGYLQAKDIVGQELQVFNGEEMVDASPMKLMDNCDVYEVVLANGMTHTITDYHKLAILESDYRGQSKKEVTLKHLKDIVVGEKVKIQTKKGCFGDIDMQDEAFILGNWQGDGTKFENSVHLCLREDQFDLVELIEDQVERIIIKYSNIIGKLNTKSIDKPKFNNAFVNASSSKTGVIIKKKCLRSTPLYKSGLGFVKGVVPQWIRESNEATQREYIKGLFYADGTYNQTFGPSESVYLSITNTDKKFLQDIQILLANLGCNFSLSISYPAGKRKLPNGKGGYAIYECKTAYRLVLGNKPQALLFESNTGFISRKGKSLPIRDYRSNTQKQSKIISITKKEKQDVYCLNITSNPLKAFIAQGMLTGNCNEVALATDENHSFVCCLSSLNLIHREEIKNSDAIETMIYFLDAVMEEFITKLEAYKVTDPDTFMFMEKSYNFAKRERALGLGVLGRHHALQERMLAFESDEAMKLNIDIFREIQYQCNIATEQLALKYGEPSLMEGYGKRNSTTCSIAPTTSSSFVLGQVSQSIEPCPSNYYMSDLAKSKITIKNKYLEKLLKEKGQNTREVRDSIMDYDGSAQHLEFLTHDEKSVFKTFKEIDQATIIQQAADRQPFIDQSQSLNLMFTPSYTPKDISNICIDAYKKGLKGLYYQKSVSASQEFARKKISCVGCEA